jgi:hypothetical protein
MTIHGFLDQMRNRRGRPIHLILRDCSSLTGVVEKVAADGLLVRDGRGRRHSLRVDEIASWEDRADQSSSRGTQRNA